MRAYNVVITWILLFCATGAQRCLGQPSTNSEAVDVIVVVDDSGSMRKNDPGFSIRPAVEIFADRLPPGSRLGLFSFDQSVTELLGLSDVTGPGFRNQLAEKLRQISYQ